MTTTYEVGFRLATTGTSSVVSDVGRVGKSFDEVGTDVRGLGDVVDRTGQKSKALLGDLKQYLVGLAGAFTIKEFVETADSMAMLDARLRTATATEREYVKAKEEVYRISQKNNVGIEEATQLYIKLADPVKRLGGTTKEVGGIVDAFAMSLRVGGASSQEASAATLQFAQAMGSGKLQGDEFRAMAEASPRFLKALADGMGMPVEKLKEMGTEGKLTSDVVGNALLKSLGKLRDEAKSLPDTVGGALTRMANDAKLAIAEINKASGMTEGIAEAISEVGKLIPLVKHELVEAFQDVSGWIQENKGHLSENWEEAKNLVGEVWGLIKIAADVAGAIGSWAGEVGLVTVSLQSARLLVAGFQDGVELIGAAFAGVGGDIIRFVMVPVGDVMEKTARFVGMFDEQLAAKIRSFAQDTVAIADGARSYADGVFQKFADGRTKVGELSDKMADAKGKADQMKVALGENGLSAAENGAEMTRLNSKLETLRGSHVTLKPAIDANTKAKDDAAKKAASLLESYDKLSAGISAKVQAEALETEGGTKLTDVQKAYLPILNALRDGKVTYTDLVGKGVIAEMENALAVETSNLARAAEVKWLQDAAKENAKNAEELDKSTLAMEGNLAKMLASNAEAKLGRDAMDELRAKRDLDTLATFEHSAKLALDIDWTGQLSAKYERQAELLGKTMAARADQKHQDYIDTLERMTTALGNQVLGEQASKLATEESMLTVGMSTEELAAFTLKKYEDLAAQKLRIAEMEKEVDWTGDTTRQYEAQAEELLKLGQLKADGIHLKAAQESAVEWKKTTDSIYEGTAKALLDGSFTGKTIYKDLLQWTEDSFSKTVLQPAIKDILSPFLDLWKDVVGFVNESVLKPLIDDVTKPFKELMKSAFAWVNEQVLKPIVENVWNPFKEWASEIFDWVGTNVLKPLVANVWEPFKKAFMDVANSIASTVIRPVINAIVSPITGGISAFFGGGTGGTGGATGGGGAGGLGSVVSGLGTLGSGISSAYSTVAGWFGAGTAAAAGSSAVASGASMYGLAELGIASTAASTGGAAVAAGGAMSGAMGAIAAAAPYVAAVIAIIALLSKKGGGPKVEGAFNNANAAGIPGGGELNNDVAALFGGVQQTYAGLATALGGKAASLTGAAFVGKDPKGTANTQFVLDAYVDGKEVFSRNNRSTGGNVEDVGRSDEALGAAVAEASTRAVLRALQETDLGNAEVNAKLDAINAGGSAAQIEAAIAAVIDFKASLDKAANPTTGDNSNGGSVITGGGSIDNSAAIAELSGNMASFATIQARTATAAELTATRVTEIRVTAVEAAANDRSMHNDLVEALKTGFARIDQAVTRLERAVADQGDQTRTQIYNTEVAMTLAITGNAAQGARLIADTVREVAA